MSAPAGGSGVRLRGVNFAGTLRALRRRFGDAVADRVVAGVPGECGAALRESSIESRGWYPIAWYDALLAAIERELPDHEHVCRELSREAVAHDLSTLFRAVSFVVTPDFALVNATRAAGLYYDGGRISVVSARVGALHFRFTAFHGATARTWDDFVGGIEAVIDSIRLVRLPTEVVLDPDDGASCEVIVRYTK